MTKKDFQLIAAAIAAMPREAHGADVLYNTTQIACKLADALERTNPLFKRDLFIQAATGVVPVTACHRIDPVFCGVWHVYDLPSDRIMSFDKPWLVVAADGSIAEFDTEAEAEQAVIQAVTP